jgi:hypothetical protein
VADPIHVDFTTIDGKAAHVVGTPGTNFGLRLEAIEVVRLSEDYGLDSLPFSVMAYGYGDDEDWVGLSQDDVAETAVEAAMDELPKRRKTARRTEVAKVIADWWGPFEVWVDSSFDPYSLPDAKIAIETLARYRVADNSQPDERARGHSFWAVDTQYDAKVSRSFDNAGSAIDAADLLNAGQPLTEELRPFTIVTALDAIQSRLEAYEARVGNDGLSPEMGDAIDVLHQLVKSIEDDTYEEWGEAGDCWERIVNDDSILEQFAEEHEGKMPDLDDDPTRDAVAEWAKAKGLGRHYGAHCIWCLQAP